MLKCVNRIFRVIFFCCLSYMLLSITNMNIPAVISSENAIAAAGGVQQFYVACNGNDNNPGTLSAPFKTLVRARDAIRSLKTSSGISVEGVTVYVRGGEYYLDNNFTLEAQDSGDDNAPIKYCAYPGEEVTLTGSKKIDGSAFATVTDENILARLSPAVAAGNKIKQVNMQQQGITDLGQINRIEYGKKTGIGPELFIDNKPMTIARWPNQSVGYTTVDKIGNIVDYGDTNQLVRGVTLQYADDAFFDRWVQDGDAWLEGYFGRDWAWESIKISSVDTTNHTITTEYPPQFTIRQNARVCAFNLLEEMDEPGEWYLDRSSGNLYIYPPYDLTNAKIQFSMNTGNLISLSNASNISIEGFTIEATRDNAISISGGKSNKIAGCIIRNIGNSGISVTNSTNSMVLSNDIYNIGATGVYVFGGSRNTLTPGNIVVDNNEIYHFGRTIRTYAPAISMGGVGNRASHNQIHDAPHTAILFGQNDTIIEYNNIYNVLQETDDAGAIYSGRDWTARGNIIRYNLLHDLGGQYTTYGVYLDDMLCGTQIYGNVFDKVPSAVFMGGGRDNYISNNIISETAAVSTWSIYADSRGTESWFAPSVTPPNGALFTSLSAVPYQQEPWASRYPELVNILNDDYKLPKRDVIKNNIIYKHNAVNIHPNVSSYGTVQNNPVFAANPGFISPETMDFRLMPNSQIINQISDFSPIPYENIGLYRDSYRSKVMPGVKMSLSQNISINVDYQDVQAKAVFDLKKTHTVKANCDITNNTGNMQSATLVVCLLSKTGVVKQVTDSRQDIPQGQSATINVNINMNTYQNGDNLKLFIWDTLESMAPLSGLAAVTVKDRDDSGSLLK